MCVLGALFLGPSETEEGLLLLHQEEPQLLPPAGAPGDPEELQENQDQPGQPGAPQTHLGGETHVRDPVVSPISQPETS